MGTRIKETANAKAAIYIHLCTAFIKNPSLLWFYRTNAGASMTLLLSEKEVPNKDFSFIFPNSFQLCPQLMMDDVFSKSISFPVSIIIGVAWLLIGFQDMAIFFYLRYCKPQETRSEDNRKYSSTTFDCLVENNIQSVFTKPCS